MPSKIHMPFLRPLFLPRFISLQALRMSTQPHLGQEVSTTVTTLASKEPNSTPSAFAPKFPVQPPAASLYPPLPYHIHRTASQNLPVYLLAKRGGNLHQTLIRKIEGSVEKLREEIILTLGLKEEHVVINRLTRHIVIKGWYDKEVKRFLEMKQF